MYKQFLKIFVENKDDLINIKGLSGLTKTLYSFLKIALTISIIVFTIDIYFFLSATGRKFGEFGDFFGGVLNPIFTFLTLLGLIITIVIQRMELRLAREEFKRTANALNTQAIENTFFNLLDLHHSIVDNLRLNYSSQLKSSIESCFNNFVAPPKSWDNKSEKGRDVFDSILYLITNNADNDPDIVLERYKTIQNKHNNILGHYFRNLYQALKFIDGYGNSLSDDEKHKYSSILRAQISSKELNLLLLNCLSGVVDNGKFKNLIIKYQMLEHISLHPKNSNDREVFFDGEHNIIASKEMVLEYITKTKLEEHKGKFEKNAFGENSGIPDSLRVIKKQKRKEKVRNKNRFFFKLCNLFSSKLTK